MTSPPVHEPETEKRPIPWHVWIIAAIVVYVILFVVLNSKSVKVSFVFFSTKTSVWIALLLAAALGFVAGLLTWRRRERRTKRD
jgi:putative membrane protein